DGKFSRFLVEESPVMEPALSARHPLVKTYRAQGLDDRAATARFGLTPYGFHAIILSPSGTYYIDPYRRGDAVNHISYFKSDFPRTDSHTFECQLHTPEGRDNETFSAESAAGFAATRPNGGTLRTYRLAFAANYEYSDFHSDDLVPDKAEVLAQGLVPAVNRVNAIYEREVAVTMKLVANEELIIFNTPADPYVNEEGISMLVTNQATIDALIGPDNYDIGHVASTGGGGVAFLGVVCSIQKAGGVTGLPQPTGDPYYVDYVAHEMGHQFGGNHTFNGTTGSCSGNGNPETAYEVGSGSTIQAYAGICTGQNLQRNSDDYFHGVSYDEILTHITTDADVCAVKTPTGNNAPSVEAGGDYTIPARTAFTLTAVGSDADGDTLTYAWEQFDLGPSGDGRADNGSSPIFRSFKPTLDPSRTLPRMADLLGNTQTYGELMPTTNRTMNFRVTARDNRAGGGGVDYDSMKVNVTAAAGPFVVTSPDGDACWQGDSARTVTWDVANTDRAPVNASSVDIHLSTDGGQTFPVLLAAGVPNDGAQEVAVPSSVSTENARIRVSASGNIFFDVSNKDFYVNPPAKARPPVANNDAAAVQFQTPTFIPVMANDASACNPTLAIAAVQSPTANGGTAVVHDNGTPGFTFDDGILYTPPVDYSGPDQFGYTLSGGELTDDATVTVTVASFCPLAPTGGSLANFEADNNGFTVQTARNLPASRPWTRLPDPQAHSPAFSFFTDGAATQGASGGKDDRLVSPPQFVSATSRLIFWHRYDLEVGWDGGVLEVSTDGGATYMDITDPGAGGVFLSGGYSDQTMSADSPLAGRKSWTGRSPSFLSPAGMNKVEVDLSALAGQTAVFRWRMIADALTPDEAVGWWVDDVQFTNLLVATVCNKPPFAFSQSVTTDEDTPAAVTLDATDPEGNPVTYAVETGPAHGTLSGTAPNLTYTPARDYNGADSFTFRASDGENRSNLATVSITVNPVDDPVAETIEDDDPRVSYSDAWHLVGGAGSAGHFRYHTGNGPGHSAALDFEVPAGKTGSVTYYFARSTRGGKADVYLDGAFKGTVSYKGATGSTKSPEFSDSYSVRFEGLAPGAHRVEIRNMGDVVYLDRFVLETAASAARPAAGPGATSEQSGTVGAGKSAGSSYAVPANAQSLSVVTESSLNLPFKLVLVDPTGLTLQTADSSNGIATISQPVAGGKTYAIKVVNLGLGPLEVTTTTTPHVTR
ncbi:MAG TPA: zinc-dependent metalloprotease family protein, partial [Pyrinomonadaceae bacterium]|nr:zinc-dependent metalloprotease family protein [Pyrinomonadaceae bacterium]